MSELIETVRIETNSTPWRLNLQEVGHYTIVKKDQALEKGHVVKYGKGKAYYMIRSRSGSYLQLSSISDSAGYENQYGGKYRSAEENRLSLVTVSAAPAWLLAEVSNMPEDIRILARSYVESGNGNRRVREIRKRQVPVGAVPEQRRVVASFSEGWNNDSLYVTDIPVRRGFHTNDLVRLKDPSPGCAALYKVASLRTEESVLKLRLKAIAHDDGVRIASAGVDLEENAVGVGWTPLDDLPGWLWEKASESCIPERYAQVEGLRGSKMSYSQMVREANKTEEVTKIEETSRWGDSGLEKLPTVELRKACMRRMGMSRTATRSMKDDEMRDALFGTGYRVSRGHLARKRSSKAREALAEVAVGLGWPETGVEELETEDIKKIVRKELRYTGEPTTLEGKVLKARISVLEKALEEARKHSTALANELREKGDEHTAARMDMNAYKGQVDALIAETQTLRNQVAEE